MLPWSSKYLIASKYVPVANAVLASNTLATSIEKPERRKTISVPNYFVLKTLVFLLGLQNLVLKESLLDGEKNKKLFPILEALFRCMLCKSECVKINKTQLKS